MRADLKCHRYIPHPITLNLEEALRVIDEDANGCFLANAPADINRRYIFGDGRIP